VIIPLQFNALTIWVVVFLSTVTKLQKIFGIEQLTQKIGLLCHTFQESINEAADIESRKNETLCEWQFDKKILDKKILAKIKSHFEIEYDIDLFASRINTQLSVFASFRPDPEATLVNAFTIDWNKLCIYCFPPFSCILRVIQKITQDKAMVPLLLELMICEPSFLSPRKTNLVLPN